MNKKLENVLAERDIMGTQLVKKNDVVAMQDSKIKLLQSTLDRGEKQYEQRLDDIKLLRLEIKRLRTEKGLLAKGIQNMIDLRLEVFNLERELNRERIRVRALEEMLETPQNIHRWRKLQGTDPGTLELLQKVQVLQIKLLEKSQKLKESKKSIEILNEQLIANQPNPELENQLIMNKQQIAKQNEKIKGLKAELSMRESQVTELKLDVERLTFELRDFKEKYYSQKKDEEAADALRYQPEMRKIQSAGMYLGGGFRLYAHDKGDGPKD